MSVIYQPLLLKERKYYKVKYPKSPIIYEFYNLEDFIIAIKKLLVNPQKNIKSSLIKYNNKYYLIIFSKIAKVNDIILNEYSNLYSPGYISYSKIKEHGFLIAEYNIISEIRKYF